MPAAALQLHRSNRLERLADELCQWLVRVGGDPFRAPVVLVQSLGMERWLRMAIAQRLGVCAHVRFPFPRAFVRELQRQLNPELPEASPWEPAVLTWRLYGLLPQLTQEKLFEPLNHYLKDADARKRHQLAGRLANLFDQYLLYRGDVVRGWDSGARGETVAEQWQSELWRRLTAATAVPHPAQLQEELLRALSAPKSAGLNVPPVAAFGISSLPPFYLEVLNRLPVPGGVQWFELHPCEEYWADIATPREEARTMLRERLRETDEQWLEQPANPLLAGLGRLGRDFLRLLLDQTEFNDTGNHFDAPEPGTLLATVQHDLLRNVARGRTEEFPRLELAAEDDSIRVHSCHGPLREIEVLRDQMLEWFQQDPTLEPRDVLVMMPDIDTYAPLVHAVFGAEGQTIPFSVADLAPSRGDRTVAAFLQLLALPETRLGAGAVLALLESELVRAKFQLSEPDLPQLRAWVMDAGIRWGRDAEHRAELGLPAQAENTWRAGLDRLLLGVAMGESDGIFAGKLATDGTGGKLALVLGQFAEFAERVFAATQELQRERPLVEWVAMLRRWLNELFAADDTSDAGIALLQNALRQLEHPAQLAGLTEPVPLAVVRQAFEPLLSDDAVHRGFLTGRVTFGALKPMRSLPFRIVCLVGMNDGAFPRRDPELGSDLIRAHPRPGDTSRRYDDRYLFLETLLSARDRLHLSYVGQSEREGSPLPPSVVVSELLDYVDEAFGSTGNIQRPSERVVVKHRLQAFHPVYFNGSDARLFSYSAENCAASAQARQPRASGSLINDPLPPPDEEWRTVTVDQLADFFSHPARYFARKRLQIYLPRAEETLEEREPFEIEAGLEAYGLRQEILTERLRGNSVDAVEQRLRAQMRLPTGATGATLLRGLAGTVEPLVEAMATWRVGEPQRPEVNLELNGFHVTGVVGDVWSGALLQGRAAEMGGRDLLTAWVRHVAWNAAQPGGKAVVMGWDKKKQQAEVITLTPPQHPKELLSQLLTVYWRGLSEPLRLFPKASYAFAEKENAGKSGHDAALKQWEGDDRNNRGEGDDEYHALFFRNAIPLDGDFPALAQQVFGPILEHEEEGE